MSAHFTGDVTGRAHQGEVSWVRMVCNNWECRGLALLNVSAITDRLVPR